MAKIKILNEKIEFEVPEGGRLSEYAKEKSSMPFGCENGECGTCLCTVVKGLENINARNHDEWLYLQKRNATPNQRLGCQIYVKKGEIEIEY